MQQTFKPYRLFLDDTRFPHEVGDYIYPFELKSEYRLKDWTIVRSFEQFIEVVLEKGVPSHVSFDHDLGEDIVSDLMSRGMSKRASKKQKKYIKSGMDCAKWFCDYLIEKETGMPIWYVHSLNPVGSDNIKAYLESFEKHFSPQNTP